MSDSQERGDAYCAGCACRDILDLIGSKWSVLIIGRLQQRTMRFGQLRRAIPGITQKMLTETLRRLEQDGLVNRRVIGSARPPQVEYSLTPLGRTIIEPLEAIRLWSEENLPKVRAARHEYEQREAAASA